MELCDKIIQELPDLNYKVLHFILGFLVDIIDHKEKNEMNLYNTCVCFAPSFLRSKVLTPQDMVYAKTMNDVLMFIIANKYWLFEEDQFDDPTYE